MKTWLTLALDAPGCSSLLDFYISGPSQQAAVEAFACAIRPQQEQPSVAMLKSEVETWKATVFANQEELATVWRMNDDLKAEIALLKKQKQLAQEPKCNPHPKAPHGFMRNSSHSNDRYVCECERWEPYEAGRAAGRQEAFDELDAPPTQPALSDERIAEIAKPFISSMGDHWCHEDGIRDNGTIEEFARAVIEAHCRGGASHG